MSKEILTNLTLKNLTDFQLNKILKICNQEIISYSIEKIKVELNDMKEIIDLLIVQKTNNFIPPKLRILPSILNRLMQCNSQVNIFKDTFDSDHFNKGL